MLTIGSRWVKVSVPADAVTSGEESISRTSTRKSSLPAVKSSTMRTNSGSLSSHAAESAQTHSFCAQAGAKNGCAASVAANEPILLVTPPLPLTTLTPPKAKLAMSACSVASVCSWYGSE